MLSFFQFSPSNTAHAATGINHQINFQGKLVNSDGTNVTDGTYSIIFSLYTVSSAGSNIWTETQSVTTVAGIFQVNLGSVTTLPGSVDFNTDNLYLGIKVGSDAEMTPRVQFTAVPQAFNSEKLGGLDKTGFIQNQTASPQTADFNISGNGALGGTLAVTSTSNLIGALTLGTASSATGQLKLGNSSSAFMATIQSAAYAQNSVITLPAASATDTICLQTLANCGSGGSGVTTVGTYSTTNTAAGGATISGTSIIFQDASASAPGMVGTGAQSFTGVKTFASNTLFSGHLAVGSTATIDQNVLEVDNTSRVASTVLNTRETTTDTTSYYHTGNTTDITFNPGATSNVNYMVGQQAFARTAVGNTQNFTGTIVGSWNEGIHNGSGTVTSNFGSAGWAFNNSTGTITDSIGSYGLVANNGGGTLTNAYGGLFRASNPGTGTITNGYGVSISTPSNGGTFTNNYGLYIQDQSGVGSTNSYNLYSAGAASKNYFAGNVGIAAAGPANKLSINTPTTADALAQVLVATGATTNKGLVLQGAASQTADLQEFQDSNTVVLSKVSSSGALTSYGTSTNLLGLATPVITSPTTTGTTAYYVVTATNAAGETIISNVLALNTASATINWTAIPGATGYKVYRNTSNAFTSGSLLRTTITNGTTVTFVDNAAATGAGLPPTAPTGTGLTLQAQASQTAKLFNAQTSTGLSVLNVDATNQFVGIDVAAPTAPLEVGVSAAVSTFNGGFESGTLAPFQTGGIFPWVLDNNGANAHTGTYSVKSTIPTTGSTSDLTITKTLTSAGTVSFWANYGCSGAQLFFIDGSSNNINTACSYTFYSFAVGSGSHTFKWRTSPGNGVFRVDDIQITNVATSNLSGIFDGAISVGTTALNQNFLLDVNTGSSTGALYAGIATSSSTDLQGGLLFHQYQANGFQVASRNTATADTGQLVFDYRTISSNAVNKANILVLQSNGNVGIGTNSPQQLLHVGKQNGGTFINDFESGALSPLTTGGSFPWVIDNNGANAHGGTYSAKSTIPSSGTSDLTLTKTLSSAGTISFWANYGCSGNQIFLIDAGSNNIGNGCSYTYYSFAVGSGTHTFTWRTSVGNGVFRLDDIQITNVAASSVSAAFDGSVGIGTTAPLAELHINAGSASTVGQIIQASASQTADLSQVQDSNSVVLRKISASGALTSYGTSTSLLGLATPTLSLTTGTAGTTYYYVITATNAAGETIQSNAIGTTTNTVTLGWTAVPGATGYKIYRNTSNAFTSGSLLASTITNGTTVSFTDSGAATAAGLPSTAPTGTGLTLQGTASQTASLLQLQDNNGLVNGSFNGVGNQLTLGRIAASGVVTQGKLVLADGTTDNFGLTIQGATLTGSSKTYTIPDSVGNATDTFCLVTLANCGGGSGVTTVGTYSTTNTAAGGATISGSSIIFQSASATAPGMVDTRTQTFAGNKTLTGQTLLQNQSDSTAAFLVQNAAASMLFNVDTTNQRISVGAVSGFSDSPTKLTDPATIPAGPGYSTAISPDGTYMSVAHQFSPYITIYKRSGDTFTKLADPATLPASDSLGTAFSPDGTYMSVALTVSPYITIYKRSGDTFTKLADPAILPASIGTGTAFSPDGTYMSVAHYTSPYITIYKRSGDTFTKLANPATLPTGIGQGTAFSPDGTYMSVAHLTSPYITIYKRSGDTFTKLANPATLPAGTGTGTAFSPDGTYMSVALTVSPYITIYKRSGDTFTKLADPAILPASAGNGTAFSPDGTYMSVAHATSPYITIYKRSGDTFTKLADPATLPTGTGRSTAFSPDGTYMSVAHDTSPYITIYKGTGGANSRLEVASALTAAEGLGFGKELQLYRSGPGTLSLAAGGSLKLDNGNMLIQGNGRLEVGDVNGNFFRVDPSATNLINGQIQVVQNATFANTIASGIVRGQQLNYTVDAATTVATINKGIDLTVTDNDTSSNTNYGLQVTLAGTNGSQSQYGVDASTTNGIAIRGVSSGTGPLTCANVTSSISMGVCGDGISNGVYGRSSGINSISLASYPGTGVYGINTSVGAGSSFFKGVAGVSSQTNSGISYTSVGVYGEAQGGSSSSVYGGYFTLNPINTATSGAALYASNGTEAVNILQLQDNGTDVFTVADGGSVGIGTSTFGTNNKLLLNPYNTVDNLATAQISTSVATNKGLVVQGSASQSANLLELQDSAGNINAAFNTTGNQLTLGRVAASGTVTQGKLVLADGTTDNFATTIQSATMTTGSRTLTLPNTSGVNDTFCLATLANCGGSGVTTVGTYSTTNTAANGATIAGSTITFQDASATAPGMVGTGAQTFAGAKTFSGAATFNSTATLNGATTINNTLSILSGSATALLIQDASSNNALAFDSGSSILKVFENVASPTNYASISYASGAAIFAASSGATQIGTGVGAGGNISLLLSNAADQLLVSKTNTPGAAYSTSDFNFTRTITGAGNAVTGNVLKVEDLSTFTAGGSVAPNVLYVNQNNTSATGNLILAQTGGGTNDKFKVTTIGDATLAGGVTIGAGSSYTGAGAVTLQSGAGTALTITGNAASTFSTTAGALTLTSAAATTWSTTAGALTLTSAAATTWSTTTGNLTIQAGGANTVVLKPGTDSAAALQVQNAAGTSMLNFDSSADQISVGVSDTTGTLLILDTKTGAGDPTGVNGGMYYNSNAGRFRCYENSAWADCLGYRHLLTVTSDVVSSGVVACQDITGLSFAVTSGTAYRFHAIIFHTASATTVGAGFGVSAPASPTLFAENVGIVSGATAVTTENITALSTCTTSTSSGSTVGNIDRVDGLITPSASGTFQLQFSPETSAANGTIIKAGSTLEWW